MIILPTAYLPSISYVAQFFRGEEIVLDLGEHFIKRSQRNRARLMTAQGEIALSVPLKHANRPKQPTQSLEIDYAQRWQHQHLHTIISAYRSAPYFEHFMPEIERFYKNEWRLLVDFNNDFLDVLLGMLELRAEAIARPRMSSEYVQAAHSDKDFRPKSPLNEGFKSQEYFQVFSDRLAFKEDLSVLDLLMCEGLNARALLEASY